MNNNKILGALITLRDYFEKLIPALEKVVGYLRRQKEDRGINLFIEALEGLEWSIEIIFHGKDYLENTGFIFDKDEINYFLNELLSGIENEDYVLVADILEYEILSFLLDVESNLNKLDF